MHLFPSSNKSSRVQNFDKQYQKHQLSRHLSGNQESPTLCPPLHILQIYHQIHPKIRSLQSNKYTQSQIVVVSIHQTIVFHHQQDISTVPTPFPIQPICPRLHQKHYVPLSLDSNIHSHF